MTLAFCEIFNAVVKCSSFVKAAQTLNMTPSAVSHAVSDMEKQIGFQLFIRTKKGVYMSEYGTSLYPTVCQLLKDRESLKQTIDQLNGLEKGTVTLGTFNSVCTNWMPDIIRIFNKKYPNIVIEIYEGGYDDVISWIKTGIVDFGFLSTSCTTELEIEEIYRDPLICLVPPDFATADEKTITIDEMKNQQFVIQQTGSDADVQMLLKKYNLIIRSNCHVIDDTSTIAMVSCGQGISIMPTLTAKGLESNMKILSLRPEEYRIIGLSAIDKALLSPAARQLYKQIVEYVKTL